MRGPWTEHAFTAAARLRASSERIWHFVSLSVVSWQCSERRAVHRRSIDSDVYSQPSRGLPTESTPQRAVDARSR